MFFKNRLSIFDLPPSGNETKHESEANVDVESGDLPLSRGSSPVKVDTEEGEENASESLADVKQGGCQTSTPKEEVTNGQTVDARQDKSQEEPEISSPDYPTLVSLPTSCGVFGAYQGSFKIPNHKGVEEEISESFFFYSLHSHSSATASSIEELNAADSESPFSSLPPAPRVCAKVVCCFVKYHSYFQCDM
jgi:hypothetical protein